MTAKTREDELLEKLAEIEHIRWADWQKWVHKCGTMKPVAGSPYLCIPAETVGRWNRQIETPYAALLDKEQLSDMEQVDRYWPLIQNYIAQNYRPTTAIKEAIGEDESYAPNWSGGRTNLLRHQIRAALQLDKGDEK